MSIRKNNRKQVAVKILQVVMIVFGLVIVGRLFQLQILEYDKFGPLSRENSLRQEVVNPARGLIYDRNGDLLVDNEPIYSITITPANYKAKNTPILADLLGVSVKKVKRKVEQAKKYSWYRSSRLFNEIDFKTFSVIQENIWKLPGIGHQLESKRHYPVDSLKASHVLGYLREVSEKEYTQNKDFSLGDQTGKSGLELAYQEQLSGKKGSRYIKVNAMGQNLGTYNNGSINEAPQKGADIITTLDTDLQLLAEDLLKGKRGAVVAMNPQNGGILSMASAPEYDVRKLSGRIDSAYWQRVNTDTTDPLYNRAISSEQPPGSTFKPVMALIGLEMGIISPQTEIESPGYYMRGRRYNDHADPGKYDVVKAIQESSNTFFFWLMDQIATNKGINKWNNLITTMGLGRRNNIDIPYEAPGIIPDSTYLNNILGKGKWGIGDQLSLGVGQGFLSTTPMQMALITSEISNGGYYVQPHLVRNVKSNNQLRSTNPEKKKISWLDESELSVVKKGMRRVVTEGTARYYADLDSIKVAGKTGTAQNPHGQDHGWFISYAPLDNPKIAVAVLVENGGYGSISAAPIASLMIEQYLNGEIGRERIYRYVKNFEPREQETDE